MGNDCDDQLDEGFDADQDGYTTCRGDCNDNNEDIHPGVPDLCNGVDDDCDGYVDDGFDRDGDGYTICQGDCVDSNPAIYPGARELCNDFDDDCDGDVDENCEEACLFIAEITATGQLPTGTESNISKVTIGIDDFALLIHNGHCVRKHVHYFIGEFRDIHYTSSITHERAHIV